MNSKNPVLAYKTQQVLGASARETLLSLYSNILLSCEQGDGPEAASILERLAHTIVPTGDVQNAQALLAFYVATAKFAKDGKLDLVTKMIQEARDTLTTP